MTEQLSVITRLLELGSSIVAAIIVFYFVYLTLKFILAGVTASVTNLCTTINQLESRITIMTNELNDIDIRVSVLLELEPDYTRISRGEHTDQRRD